MRFASADVIAVNITGAIKNTGNVTAKNVEAVFDLGSGLSLLSGHSHHQYTTRGNQLVVKAVGSVEIPPNSVYTENLSFVLSSKHGCGRQPSYEWLHVCRYGRQKDHGQKLRGSIIL